MDILTIIPFFTKIITAPRTAVANEYNLDKEATSYGDCPHALCLSLLHYEFAKTILNSNKNDI
jgi:hypothetical protein